MNKIAPLALLFALLSSNLFAYEVIENEVPGVHIPADCVFLCGLAGTTLSVVLAQRYPECKVYVGSEGMYNVLEQDTSLSNFPSAKGRTAYGLVSHEQKQAASAYHQLRAKPAASLLLYGQDDWLCHYSQSEKYAKKLKQAGGKCKLLLYEGINHTCFSIAYPEVFKNSIVETARLYARGYGLKNINFKTIKANLDEKTENYYLYENIPDDKLTGRWKSRRYDYMRQWEKFSTSWTVSRNKSQINLTAK